MGHSHFKSKFFPILVLVFLVTGMVGGVFDLSVAQAQFNENCFVSILNRTAQVQANGAWEILNLPSDFGPVRASATCLENGLT